MSLLWKTAVGLGKRAHWSNDEFDETDEDVRDPDESMEDRRARHIDHIHWAHGVPHEKAAEVYDKVRASMGRHHVSPEEFGFAPHKDVPLPGGDGEHAKRWHFTQPEEIDLTKHKLHAGQGWVQPNGLAHKLFHGDSKYPAEEHRIGDPDYDPEDEHDDGWGNDWDEHEDKFSRPPGDYARVYRDEHGNHHVVNGHHRLAIDLALGKPTTTARVWDAKNPPPHEKPDWYEDDD